MPAPTATLASPAHRSFQAVAWWVYHVSPANRATLFRCDSLEEAERFQARIQVEIDKGERDGFVDHTSWRVNEWNARRQMGVRGWAVGAVIN